MGYPISLWRTVLTIVAITSHFKPYAMAEHFKVCYHTTSQGLYNDRAFKGLLPPYLKACTVAEALQSLLPPRFKACCHHVSKPVATTLQVD